MIPVSVVIIAFNEERSISRCIESVKTIADEVVVIDSGSTDRTVELAQQLGARVENHPFEGHIEQKNFAITRVTFPHVLSLDADEWLDSKLLDEIKKIKSNWNADGYMFNRLNNYCGKWIRHGAWYPDKKLRLWDSRKGSWQGLNPHDEFIMGTGSLIEYIPLDILHQSYVTVEEHKMKTEYFSELAAHAYFNKGYKSKWYHSLFSPAFRFIRDYFFKAGFLDGKAGLTIAWLTAREVRLKYLKLRQLQFVHS